MPINSELIEEPKRFAELDADWRELLERSSVNDPTLCPTWHRVWWQVFGPLEGRRLRVIAVRDSGRLVGLAPFVLRRHWYRPGIPVRRLDLCCSGEPQDDEVMSEYNGVLAERGSETAVAKEIVRTLGAAGGWDELEMPVLSPDNPMTYALHRALLAGSHPSELETQTSASYISLPDTWEAYLASIGSQSRYLVNRTLRDLDAWAGGDVTFEVARTRKAFEKGRAILLALHAERWGDEVRPGGVFGSERFLAFHDRIMPWLFEHNALELAWLSARDEPIAVLYNFVWNDKTYQYQSGRRMNLPKSIRAGIAVNAYAIREAILRGRREYDFLGGDDRYKEQLATAQRPLLRIRATRGAVGHLARRAARRGVAGARAIQEQLRALRARVTGSQVPSARV